VLSAIATSGGDRLRACGPGCVGDPSGYSLVRAQNGNRLVHPGTGISNFFLHETHEVRRDTYGWPQRLMDDGKGLVTALIDVVDAARAAHGPPGEGPVRDVGTVSDTGPTTSR
jgi:hypothetical protein